MTRWNNYDAHASYDISTFANASSKYWPTNNCSRPLALSTVTQLITTLALANVSNRNMRQKVVVDGFELIHDGNADVRVKIDDVEGFANESLGHILKPGEIWSPPFRLINHLSLYTSSNVSQPLRLTVGAYV